MDRVIKATAEMPRERLIRLEMPESQARQLMSILMYRVDWHSDPWGKTADSVYDALDDVGVSEAD